MLFLCGFSGSGKTHFLQKLSSDGRLRALDLDHEVAKEVGCSPDQLGNFIDQQGMSEFRKRESQVLDRLLKTKALPLTVIGLGGGALSQEHLSWIQRDPQHKLIWLNTPFEICWQRIANDPNRPLARSGKEKMQELFLERAALYRQAHLILDQSQSEQVQNFSDLLVYLKRWPGF